MDQVIDRVLEMEKHSSFMSLGVLHWALPKEVDLRFLTSPEVHGMSQLGPLNGRLHHENVVHDMPLLCTHERLVRVQPA